MQVEAGATLTAGPAVVSGPEALVRLGLGRAGALGFEARLVLPDAASGRAVGEAALGGGSVGAKLELPRAGGFDAGAILDVTRSAGDRPSPRAVLILGRDTGPRTAAAGQVELRYDPDAGRARPAATLVGNADLGRGTGAFLEVAASGEPDGPASVVLHTGLTRLAGDAVQFDVHGGLGLTAPDAFVAGGVSVRF